MYQRTLSLWQQQFLDTMYTRAYVGHTEDASQEHGVKNEK